MAFPRRYFLCQAGNGSSKRDLTHFRLDTSGTQLVRFCYFGRYFRSGSRRLHLEFAAFDGISDPITEVGHYVLNEPISCWTTELNWPTGFVCLFVCLSVCLSVCLFVYLLIGFCFLVAILPDICGGEKADAGILHLNLSIRPSWMLSAGCFRSSPSGWQASGN